MRWVTLLALGILLSACGTATIYKRGTGAIEARILSSNADSLRVECADGTTQILPRSEIAGIDHPGDTAAAAGTVFAAAGLAMLIIGAENCPRDDEECKELWTPVAGVGGALFISNLILSVSGWAFWLLSRSRAEPPEHADASPDAAPFRHVSLVPLLGLDRRGSRLVFALEF